jgi:hypothetical protein
MQWPNILEIYGMRGICLMLTIIIDTARRLVAGTREIFSQSKLIATGLKTNNMLKNLVSTFVDRGVSRGQRGGSPTVVNLSFLDRTTC